jgi:hypothetical protein
MNSKEKRQQVLTNREKACAEIKIICDTLLIYIQENFTELGSVKHHPIVASAMLIDLRRHMVSVREELDRLVSLWRTDPTFFDLSRARDPLRAFAVPGEANGQNDEEEDEAS